MIHINKYLNGVVPYKPVNSLDKIKDFKDKPIFKLDWNESTIPPPKKIIQKLVSFLQNKNNLNWYADPTAKKLKIQLAKSIGVNPDELIITNGSDQAHELICNTFLEDGDEVVIPIPSYSNFLVWPKIRGSKIIEIPYTLKTACSIDAIAQKLNQKTKMVYLINPYICLYTIEEIKKLALIAKNSLILIDEAYADFHGKSCVNLIKECNNIILTRSFSKASSIAGLRLGYIVANKNIILDLSKIHNFKSVNVLAQIVGEAILRDDDFVRKYVQEVNKSTELITPELNKLNFEVFTTPASFILFKHKILDNASVLRLLEKNGIFVRDISKTQAFPYLRMNVGTLNQTKNLISLMKKLFSLKAVFLDRDGTLLEEPSGPNIEDYVITSVSEMHLLPNAIAGLKKITQLGYTPFIISNQDGINRKQLTLETYHQMNQRLIEIFGKNGIKIEKWLVCPHLPEEKCTCRKPETGMIDNLKNEYYFNFKESYLIGDRDSDILLAKRLKMQSILMKRNEREFVKAKNKADYYAESLLSACKFL